MLASLRRSPDLTVPCARRSRGAYRVTEVQIYIILDDEVLQGTVDTTLFEADRKPVVERGGGVEGIIWVMRALKPRV